MHKFIIGLVGLVLLVTGCVGGPPRYPFKETKQNRTKIQRVMGSVNYIIKVWEKDFSKKVDPFLLHTEDEIFKLGDMRLIGLYETKKNLITVWTGKEDSLPAFYHELCHMMRVSKYGLDGTHSDPRWKAWNRRSHALASLIERTRKKNARFHLEDAVSEGFRCNVSE